jgi:hypothetical protein
MKSKICEGQNVPHAHLTDAQWYRYLGKHPKNDPGELFRLCSRCVQYERSQGYILERHHGPVFQRIETISFYPNDEE